MKIEDNIGLVRAYLDAVAAFDGEAAKPLLHEDVVQTEYPNRLTPATRTRNRDALIADMRRGAALLTRQAYPIEAIVADGDRVTVETRWEGVLAVPLGSLAPGDNMTAHICMTFRIEDGRIISQHNYDCFDAF